jgi:hypothetical protein
MEADIKKLLIRSLVRTHTTSLYVMPEVLNRASMVRQAHHDNCHPEHVEGWIPRSSRGMTKSVALLMNFLVRAMEVRR